MKPGYFVGGLVIVLCVVVTAMALSGTVRRTVTFEEALASQQPCEIYGSVVPHSAKQDTNGRFSFTLAEERSVEVDGKMKTVPTGATMTVVSLKPKPSNFEQASHVKAIGTVTGAEFAAHDLLVKCPSKYQGVEKPKETTERADAELTGLGMAGVTVGLGLAAFAVIYRTTRG
jgi:cytochrome c-type biogenesis protein CcmE